MNFDWDAENESHIERHQVSRREVEEVLSGEPLEYPAHARSGERRLAFVGPTRAGRMLFVVATVRGEAIRPITAFPARRSMRALYAKFGEEEIK